ncbi:MAG: hypothetical protein KDB06_06275 [Ilumatobacter sp.]|nr:hypothetical protein [Ilumatobacter sp.]MCB0984242.1 hypothetical protein [Ilumatobacter sp.]
MHHSTHTIRTDRSARLVGVAVAGLASIGTFALAAPAAHADDEVSEEILVIGTKDDTGGDTGTDTISIPLDMLIAYFPNLNISLPDLGSWWNGNGGDTVAPGTPDVDCDDLEDQIANDVETMSRLVELAIDPAQGELHEVAWLNHAEVVRRLSVDLQLYNTYCK